MGKNKPLLKDITLTTAGAKGVAIGKTAEGKTVMVRNAVPGDVVDVQVYKKKRNYFEGNAVKFSELSSHRTTPKCKHFGTCGGCKWQNMAYDSQLHFKQKEVTDHLTRIGGFQNLEISPILGSSKIYEYRNKMEFSFSNSRWITQEEIERGDEILDRNALGFHIPGMWSKILDLEECHLQASPSNDIRLAVKAFAEEHNMAFFDPVEQTGFLRTLMIRTATTGELMVLLQFREENKSMRELLLNHLATKFPEITSLLYAINPKKNDSLYDLDIHLFAGKDYIMEEMEGLQFKIGPKSFYQTNPTQAYELYKIARDFAQLTGNEIVYDLYTGTGTIAQFVAQKAQKVVGVEAVPEAIAAAKENAARNQIDNCVFYCGDMKNVFSEEFVNENGKPDVIITDPPRDGMHPKVVENILRIAPQRIVYVSCNSATQARDLALMKEEYELVKIQPVDMFPQTYHVENVVLLERKPSK